MLRKTWPIIPVILLIAFALISFSVYAQYGGSVSDDEVNKVAGQLYCPVCENITLDVCPTLACTQWRNLIREKLTAGWSARQIENYFVEQYGDRVLAVPPRTGLNWLFYVVILLILIGIVLVPILIFRSNNKYTIAPILGPTIDPNVLAKIQNDINNDD